MMNVIYISTQIVLWLNIHYLAESFGNYMFHLFKGGSMILGNVCEGRGWGRVNVK